MDTASEPTQAAPAAALPKRREQEWERARAAVARLSERQLEFQRRARLSLGLGDQGFAPSKALPAGAPLAQALELYRQAAYWALLAKHPELEGKTAGEAWDAAASMSDTPQPANERLASLLRADFPTFSELGREQQLELAAELRELAQQLSVAAKQPLLELEWLRVRRIALVFGLAIVLLGLAFLIPPLFAKPNLAAGKPWTASSELVHCDPAAALCGGVTTVIFFHTKQEQEPWLRYDFGKPLAFSSLSVRNRTDFGRERAVPLVAEVSTDGEHYTEVARVKEAFTTWEPRFATQHARYLRLRVARESMLHLESVEVYP